MPGRWQVSGAFAVKLERVGQASGEHEHPLTTPPPPAEFSRLLKKGELHFLLENHTPRIKRKI